MSHTVLVPCHDEHGWFCKDDRGRRFFSALGLDCDQMQALAREVNFITSTENAPCDDDEDDEVPGNTPLKDYTYTNKQREAQRYDRNDMRGMDVVKAYLSEEQFEGFLRGNIFKYMMRYDYKGGYADLLKAEDYIAMLVALNEEGC